MSLNKFEIKIKVALMKGDRDKVILELEKLKELPLTKDELMESDLVSLIDYLSESMTRTNNAARSVQRRFQYIMKSQDQQQNQSSPSSSNSESDAENSDNSSSSSDDSDSEPEASLINQRKRPLASPVEPQESKRIKFDLPVPEGSIR